MKTVTRSLLLSYSPLSSDQLVEFYCRRSAVIAVIYSKYVELCITKYEYYTFPNMEMTIVTLPYLMKMF